MQYSQYILCIPGILSMIDNRTVLMKVSQKIRGALFLDIVYKSYASTTQKLVSYSPSLQPVLNVTAHSSSQSYNLSLRPDILLVWRLGSAVLSDRTTASSSCGFGIYRRSGLTIRYDTQSIHNCLTTYLVRIVQTHKTSNRFPTIHIQLDYFQHTIQQGR